jgi:hypothetical protein
MLNSLNRILSEDAPAHARFLWGQNEYFTHPMQKYRYKI